jgi:predicted NUDIX family NTP pyrophosphohydrolase
MPTRTSAGLVLYRIHDRQLEFLLVHPGGPFWKNKDAGSWTIPKGEPHADEPPFQAAQREFEEETGFKPHGQFLELTAVKQKGGKVIQAWAFEGDWDPARIRSNRFTLEWPPRSGRQAEFPEVDRAAFFSLDQAKEKLNPAQLPLLQELAARIASRQG